MEDLVANLIKVHDPDSRPEQRRDALAVCEQFKQQGNVGLALRLVYEAQSLGGRFFSLLQHFGLQSLLDITSRKWYLLHDSRARCEIHSGTRCHQTRKGLSRTIYSGASCSTTPIVHSSHIICEFYSTSTLFYTSADVRVRFMSNLSRFSLVF